MKSWQMVTSPANQGFAVARPCPEEADLLLSLDNIYPRKYSLSSHRCNVCIRLSFGLVRRFRFPELTSSRVDRRDRAGPAKTIGVSISCMTSSLVALCERLRSIVLCLIFDLRSIMSPTSRLEKMSTQAEPPYLGKAKYCWRSPGIQ
ncbi:uncharacterized protein LOC143261239 isoform X2 [Megalopta genalis]|uniref:uncharacterized protein LOC143261239 isoform X2 n=1 Tax=Megalopta genalis TaxID=115081 RepID=UPI003FCF6F58